MSEIEKINFAPGEHVVRWNGHEVTVWATEETFEIHAGQFAKAFGYRGAETVTRNLAGQEVGTQTVCMNLADGRVQQRKVSTITEAGFWRLVSTLRRPEFEQWQERLYHVIVPSVARTGHFVNPEALDQDQSLEEQLAGALETSNGLLEKFRTRVHELEAARKVEKPKAERVDRAVAYRDNGGTALQEACKQLAEIAGKGARQVIEDLVYRGMIHPHIRFDRLTGEWTRAGYTVMLGYEWIFNAPARGVRGQTRISRTLYVTGEGMDALERMYRGEVSVEALRRMPGKTA